MALSETLQITVSSCFLLLTPILVDYSVIERLDEHRRFMPLFRDVIDHLMDILGKHHNYHSVRFVWLQEQELSDYNFCMNRQLLRLHINKNCNTTCVDLWQIRYDIDKLNILHLINSDTGNHQTMIITNTWHSAYFRCGTNWPSCAICESHKTDDIIG